MQYAILCKNCSSVRDVEGRYYHQDLVDNGAPQATPTKF